MVYINENIKKLTESMLIPELKKRGFSGGKFSKGGLWLYRKRNDGNYDVFTLGADLRGRSQLAVSGKIYTKKLPYGPSSLDELNEVEIAFSAMYPPEGFKAYSNLWRLPFFSRCFGRETKGFERMFHSMLGMLDILESWWKDASNVDLKYLEVLLDKRVGLNERITQLKGENRRYSL